MPLCNVKLSISALTRKNQLIVLIITGLVAAGVVGVTGTGTAHACDISTPDHCYAQSVLANSDNHGIYGNLYVNCLYTPSPRSSLVTQEIWDDTENLDYWVEVGVIDGLDYYGNTHNQGWFWADSRPNGGGFAQHFPGSQVTLDTSLPVQIQRNGSSSWNVYGGDSFHQIGTSTNNPITMYYQTGGSEYSLNSGSDLRSDGHVGGLEYQNSSNTFYYWGSDGGNDPVGPSYWISSSYDTGSSTASWSTC